jgi:hypothetical protein
MRRAGQRRPGFVLDGLDPSADAIGHHAKPDFEGSQDVVLARDDRAFLPTLL